MPIDKLASATGITKEQMLEVLAMALGYRIKSQYGDVWMSGAAQAVCNVLATLSGLPVYEFMQAVDAGPDVVAAFFGVDFIK